MTRRRRRRDAGFTLIEALVTLAIVSASMAALGEAFRANLRTARDLEDRLRLIGRGEAIFAQMADRAAAPGTSASGVSEDVAWRVDVRPLAAAPRTGALWVARSLVVTLTAPSGQRLRLETVRLFRASGRGG